MGVPVMAPVVELVDRPGGSPLPLYVYGGVPPVAEHGVAE